MAGGTVLGGMVETGPRALAAAIGLGVGLKFLKWLIEFTFSRMDVSRTEVGRRLKKCEQELDAYRETTMLMIGVVAKLDPGNPALLRVAQILRTIPPRATIEVDELVKRLGDIPAREAK